MKRKCAESPWLLVEFLNWDYFKWTLHKGSNRMGPDGATTRQNWEQLQNCCSSWATSVVWRRLLVVCLLKVLSARRSCFQQWWPVGHQKSVSATLWAGLPTAMEGLELLGVLWAASPQRKEWCFTLCKPLLHCQLRKLCSLQTWLLLACTYFVLSSGCRETPGPGSFSCSVMGGLFCARDRRSMSQSWKPHPREGLAVR